MISKYSSPSVIAGEKIGKPMSFEEAMKGANPEYSHFGNPTYRKNCQSVVDIMEARKRGYNLKYKKPQTPEELEIQEILSKEPNFAYFIPGTKKVPSMDTVKCKTSDECLNILNKTINNGERYILAHSSKSGNSAHIIMLTKDEHNKLKFYDPQSNYTYDERYLLNIRFKFSSNEKNFYPKILRIDDKEFNYKYINAISQPSCNNK